MKFIYCLAFFFACHLALGHAGGHGHSNKNIRTWKLSDESIKATGAFHSSKNGLVFIETVNEIVSIPISDLSLVDKEFVERRIQFINEINKVSPNTPKVDTYEAGLFLPNWVYFLILGLAIIALLLFANRLKRTIMSATGTTMLTVLVLVIATSCNTDETASDDALDISNLDATGVQAAFAPYSDLVTTSADNDYVYVESTGIPSHQMMVGITAWIAQVPIPFPFSGENAWSIPLNPEYSSETVSIESDLRRGAIGIAANGIPIFNPVNASGLVSKEIGELDEFGGHSGRGDDYHYHTAPLHLESSSGGQPIAFALDGYPVYGSKEPDANDMEDLDEYHGHEYNGMYHYHGTTSYPYMVSKMRGKVTLGGTSPETQIEPQPVAQALRKEIHPINSDNLLITNLENKSTGDGYVLTYTIDGVEGSVDYSWNEDELFTFIFNDVDGSTTTETYQR